MPKENQKDQEKNTLTIELKAKEINHEGKSFTAFKALTKDGRWIDAKFRKKMDSGKTIPEESGEITVKPSQVQYVGPERKKYPEIWIRDFEKFTPLEDVKREFNEDNLPF